MAYSLPPIQDTQTATPPSSPEHQSNPPHTVQAMGRELSIVDAGDFRLNEETDIKSDHPLESTHIPKKKKKKKKKKKTDQSCDLRTQRGRAIIDADMKLNMMSEVGLLAKEADEATEKLLQFDKLCSKRPEQKGRFHQPRELAEILAPIKTRCSRICDDSGPYGDLSQGVDSRVQITAPSQKIYNSDRARLFTFLAYYNRTSAKCHGANILRQILYAISSNFSEQGNDKKNLGASFRIMMVEYSQSLSCFTQNLTLLEKNQEISRKTRKELKGGINSVAKEFYLHIALLYTSCKQAFETIRSQPMSYPSNSTKTDNEKALTLLQTLYSSFAPTDEGKAFLTTDKHFVIPNLDEGDTTIEDIVHFCCIRVIVGVIASQFEMVSSSMCILAKSCHSAQHCIQRRLLWADPMMDFPTIALELSLLAAQQLPHGSYTIIDIQKKRQQALDFLDNVQVFWSYFYPKSATNTDGDEQQIRLMNVYEKIKKGRDETIQRAIKALDAMERSHPPKKVKPAEVAGELVIKLCESLNADKTDQEEEAVGASGLSVAEQAHIANWKLLQEASENLKTTNTSTSFRNYLQITSCTPENALPEQRLLAIYGLIEFYQLKMEESYNICLSHTSFLQSYYSKLQQQQLPSPKEGTIFSTKVENFLGAFQSFVMDIDSINRKQKELEKILLLEESRISDDIELHNSLESIRVDCHSKTQELNNYVCELPDICHLRKWTLSNLPIPFNPVKKSSYDYEKALSAIKESNKSLTQTLTELETGFKERCKEISLNSSNN